MTFPRIQLCSGLCRPEWRGLGRNGWREESLEQRGWEKGTEEEGPGLPWGLQSPGTRQTAIRSSQRPDHSREVGGSQG